MKTQNFAAQIKELKDSYAALPAALLESEAKVVEATKVGDLAGVQAASAELRKVADEFKGKLEAAYTTEPFGERIFIPDLLALQQFAKDNGKDEKVFYEGVTLESGRVVSLNADDTGITCLVALKPLGGLRVLSCSHNEGLKTLKGVPMESMEVLTARDCGLIGGLSALSNAKRLIELHVSGNRLLNSLNGVATESLEEISAALCGLRGDLSALSSARRLSTVNVRSNAFLNTLTGVPTESLEVIYASDCDLKDDDAIKVLTSARKLTTSALSGNPFKSKTTPLITLLRKRIEDFRI